MIDDVADRDPVEIKFPCLRAKQPIGDIFFATINSEDLCRISYFDVRRILRDERDVEKYLGIQRPLIPRRVKSLESYVNYVDATFPTSIIIAIDSEYATFSEETSEIIVRNMKEGDNAPSIPIRNLARVIDGQHRIAGLFQFKGGKFEVPVTIFTGMDVADQAYVFSTVNLEQTKVNKSLAYDLFELAKTRSPQKTAHNIAVMLDRDEQSPFSRKIKRLGFATPGRNTSETITQSQFVEALLKYISSDPKHDRDQLLRSHKLPKVDGDESQKYFFRNMFIDGRDLEIAEVINNYFSAVQSKWPESWAARGERLILGRTNGFRALMRLLRDLYIYLGEPGDVVSQQSFLNALNKSDLKDADINSENYAPGSSGESQLYRELKEAVLPA